MVINSKDLVTMRLAKQVHVKIGTWERTTDLIVVRMNDFDVILDMEFQVEKGDIPIPSTRSLLIKGEKPTMVATKVKQVTEWKLLYILQSEKSVNWQEPIFVAVLAVCKDEGREPIHLEIKSVLKKYRDIIPD